MSQVNDHWDDLDENGDPIAPIWQGQGAHVRTFIQDSFGNVIAVKDNTLQHTTVRISYSPTGEPILDSYYSGADFDRNGGPSLVRRRRPRVVLHGVRAGRRDRRP